MSLMTSIQKFRTNRKIEQEKTNTSQDAPANAKNTGRLFIAPAFALAFVFALAALTVPVSAEINLSVITEVINAFIVVIDPIVNLVIAIVPLWFIMQILGFIMGLLAAILAMIKFGRH